MDIFACTDFEYEVYDDVIVIFDLDIGGSSVTNNIKNVLAAIKQDLGGTFGNCKVIYRDSMKIFDGVGVNSAGYFTEFYPIQEQVLEDALNKIRL